MRPLLALSLSFLLPSTLLACGDNAPAGPLVFAAALDGATSTDLYTIGQDGTGLVRLTDTPESERFPRWSPDRERIAYMIDADLYVVGADGRFPRKIAGPVGRDGLGVTAPAWSPDGYTLAYSYPRTSFMVEGEDQSYATTLHFVDAGGFADAPFVEPDDGAAPPGLATLTEPTWSPGGELAFREDDDCPDCAGGHVWSLTTGEGDDYRVLDTGDFDVDYPVHDLAWSPDGTRWAFTTAAEEPYESAGQIAVMSTAPGAAAVILADGGHMPRWSPSGERVAFLRADGIFTMAAGGGDGEIVLEATEVRGLDW